jgi:hypothetical protein
MYMLGAMFLLWAALPACIFRQPLFAPEYFGYGPRGVLGWVVIIAFWIVISLSISFTARYSARRDERRRDI